MRFTRSKRCIFNYSFHLEWCSKYRKPYLMRFEKELIKYINIKAEELKISVEAIDIMPDHVHLFIKCKLQKISVPEMVKHLKGYSSYMVRKNHPELKKYKAFWAPSYFFETIGHISKPVIVKYILNQKNNVKSNYKYKNLI